MTPDEQLDRLLSRAKTNRRTEAVDPCLEPETLAAFSERSLDPARHRRAEAHLSSCDRCLAVLAAVQATEPAPAPRAAGWWRPWPWVVPLTAGAAAAALWIAGPQSPRPPVAEPAAPAAKIAAPEFPQREASAPPPPSHQFARLQSDTAARTEAAEVQPGTAAPKAQGPAERSRQETAASPPPPQPRSAEASALARERLADASPIVIDTPDPRVRWRLSGAAVERSLDAGRTWDTRLPDAGVRLHAGSCPTAALCWAAGSSGRVLLTADGGQTWESFDVPGAGDLVRVAAAGARQVTVSDTAGGTYRTDNGGLTWHVQDPPTAPF